MNEIWLYLGIFIFVDLLIVYFVFFRKNRNFSEKDKRIIFAHWQRVTMERDHKKAILEADKLLDHVLKMRGYKGSLGDKLKLCNNVFADIDGVWEAHKIRNKIAHELDFRLSTSEGNKAIGNFKRALRDLGAL